MSIFGIFVEKYGKMSEVPGGVPFITRPPPISYLIIRAFLWAKRYQIKEGLIIDPSIGSLSVVPSQQEYSSTSCSDQEHEKNKHSRNDRVVLGLVVLLRNVEEEQWYTTATTTTTTTSVVVTSILPLFFRHRRLHPRHHPRDDDHNTKNNNSSNSVRRGNFDRPEEEEGTTSY